MATEGDNTKVNSVAILLAAGSSSRMGQSKQLLKIENESLLRKTVRTVIDSGVDKIIVVLGAGRKVHQKEIMDLPVDVVYNQDWKKGIGSSLKLGIYFVEEEFPSCEAILVTVCDQPLLTAHHLKKLSDTYQSKKSPIVASFYSGSPGVPVLFHRSMFQKIVAGADEHGAKKIVNDFKDSASFVDFPDGALDLDTLDDWNKFTQSR